MKRRDFLSLLSVAPLATAEPQTTPLRLLSYNIKHGQGMDGKTDLTRAAGLIKREEVDLVALQEVDQRCGRSGKVDQAAELGRLTGFHSAFGSFMDHDGGQYGLAVLSRWAIEQSLTHRLPEGAEPRVAQEIQVTPPGGSRISFVCLHLDWTKTELRIAQMKVLLDKLADRSHPVILAGDFNDTPESDLMRLIGKSFSVLPKALPSATWPSDKPEQEIDFFAVRGMKGKETPTCTVIPEEIISDHRPIRVELLLP